MQTPQLPYIKLSAATGVNNEIWLKREDLHPCGSHKGRSIPLMIGSYVKQGIFDFVISSSGNAALCALRTINSHNQNKVDQPLFLKIFVGKKIDQIKLNLLKKEMVDNRVIIKQVDNPKQRALQTEKTGETKWLRQSTDDLALIGYEQLSQELSAIPNLSAVFIPTSSGTAALGLYLGFNKLGINPQIHIIQTPACHPLVEKYQEKEQTSLAGAIVDKIAHRKTAILNMLKLSNGGGWVATDNEILSAIKMVKDNCQIDISANSALSIVGLQQALKKRCKWSGSVVCLITGA